MPLTCKTICNELVHCIDHKKGDFLCPYYLLWRRFRCPRPLWDSSLQTSKSRQNQLCIVLTQEELTDLQEGARIDNIPGVATWARKVLFDYRLAQKRAAAVEERD